MPDAFQERFNTRHYHGNPFVWAHRRLPEPVRMWSPWWLRHVVAVERTMHNRTREDVRAKQREVDAAVLGRWGR